MTIFHILTGQYSTARQNQRNINGTKSAKLAANERKICSGSAQFINMWLEKQLNRRMGYHAQVFPHKHCQEADHSAQNQRFVLPGASSNLLKFPLKVAYVPKVSCLDKPILLRHCFDGITEQYGLLPVAIKVEKLCTLFVGC